MLSHFKVSPVVCSFAIFKRLCDNKEKSLFDSCREKRDRDEGEGYEGDTEQGRSAGVAGADGSAASAAAATASDGGGAATRSSAGRSATATPGHDHSRCAGRADGTTPAARSV